MRMWLRILNTDNNAWCLFWYTICLCTVHARTHTDYWATRFHTCSCRHLALYLHYTEKGSSAQRQSLRSQNLGSLCADYIIGLSNERPWRRCNIPCIKALMRFWNQSTWSSRIPYCRIISFASWIQPLVCNISLIWNKRYKAEYVFQL